mmetsp:Transcript_11287/g.18660  ORF Transcript_11287/g.18660 Transcript_11287/m.18660 type:complete len:252 (+) Transcript_11287:493-1248(+)
MAVTESFSANLSICLRISGISAIKTEGSTKIAYLTEEPKNCPGDSLGRCPRAKLPEKACIQPEEACLTGKSVQKPCRTISGKSLLPLSVYTFPSERNRCTSGLSSDTKAMLHRAFVCLPTSPMSGRPAPTKDTLEAVADGICSASLSRRIVNMTASHPFVTKRESEAASSHDDGVQLSALLHSLAQGNTGVPRKHSRSNGEHSSLVAFASELPTNESILFCCVETFESLPKGVERSRSHATVLARPTDSGT